MLILANYFIVIEQNVGEHIKLAKQQKCTEEVVCEVK
jgi:hypothetical protein